MDVYSSRIENKTEEMGIRNFNFSLYIAKNKEEVFRLTFCRQITRLLIL